jgi:hypothetical protein
VELLKEAFELLDVDGSGEMDVGGEKNKCEKCAKNGHVTIAQMPHTFAANMSKRYVRIKI